MADNSRIAALRLRFEVERTGAKEALKTIDQLKTGYRDLALGTGRITPEAMRAGAAMFKANQQAKSSAIEATKANEQLNKSLKNTGFLSDETRGKLSTIRTENRAESFATRTVANVLPGDVGRTASQVFDLIDTIPDLSTAFSVLKASILDTLKVLGGGSALAGGVLIGAIAALGVALKFMQDQVDRARESVERQVKAAEAYNRTVETLNTKQINEQIETKKEELRIAEKSLEDNKRIFGETAETVLGSSTNIELGLRGVLNIFRPDEIAAAGQAVVTAQKQVDDLKIAIDDLGRAAGDTAVAARDAALAQDAFVNANISVLLQAQKLTGEQAKARLTAINDEIAAIETYLNTAGQTEENIALNQERLDQLNLEGSLLQTLIPTLIAHNDALAYEAKQRTDTIAAVEKYNSDLTKINQQARDAETAAHEKYADAVIQIAERAADAAENALRKLQEKRADLALGLSRDFEDAEIERQRDQIDAQIKFADEEAKAARQHADDLKRIRREGQRDENQAIQDRDAVALDAAQTRTRDQLRDANESYQQDARERAIAYAQELRDQRTQFERERQDTLTKYNRDLMDAQMQYNREIALAEQNRVQALQRAAIAHQQELAQITQKYANERLLRQQAITAELALITMGYQQRARVQAMYENALVAQSQRILSQLSGNSGYGSANAPTQDTGTVIPFARGGNAPANRDLLVGEHGPERVRFRQPSRIYSASQTRGMGGGAGTLNLNVNGVQIKTIDIRSRAQADAAISDALDQMMGVG